MTHHHHIRNTVFIAFLALCLAPACTKKSPQQDTSANSAGTRETVVPVSDNAATGQLDKEVIREGIRSKLPEIQQCYDKELPASPGLEGTVIANFVIDRDGAVTESSAEGVSETVSACVAQAIRTIQFPEPSGDGVVTVSYPFTFRASEPDPA